MSTLLRSRSLSMFGALVIVYGCGSERAPTGPSGQAGGSPVLAVSIAATRTTFGTDQTMQFEATAQRQDGTSATCTSTAVWQSSNASIMTVSAGLARGVAVGEADIRATCGSVTGSIRVTIISVQASRVSVDPTQVTLAPGQTQQLKANVCFTDGTCGDCTATATWETLPLGSDNIAVDPHGLVTALAVGDGAAVRVHCGPPFDYAFIRVHLPDESFGHRVEFTGVLCGSPDAPGQVSTRCIYGGDSTEAHEFIDVAVAGSMQIFVRALGGHDFGDSLDLDVRCANRLVRLWSSGDSGTVAFPVEPCRYEIKLRDTLVYGQRYQMTIQYP